MKRFTSTEKWDDPWFWELSPQAKLLWLFLCDHCDHAGIFDVSLKLASMKIGDAIEEKHLAELQSRIHTLKSGKRIITSFIRFQYGKLNPECKPHRPAFVSLEKHGVTLDQVDTICNGYSSSIKGYPNSIQTHPEGIQTLKDKNKDKNKDKKGGVGGSDGSGGSGGLGVVGVLRSRLNEMFGRNDGDPWSYAEEHGLADVAKRRDAILELGEIQSYRASIPRDDARYSGFPKTLGKLIDGWTGALDMARAEDAMRKNGKQAAAAEAEKPKRSTEFFVWPGIAERFTAEKRPEKSQFPTENAFMSCVALYENWLTWRSAELRKVKTP